MGITILLALGPTAGNRVIIRRCFGNCSKGRFLASALVADLKIFLMSGPISNSSETHNHMLRLK